MINKLQNNKTNLLFNSNNLSIPLFPYKTLIINPLKFLNHLKLTQNPLQKMFHNLLHHRHRILNQFNHQVTINLSSNHSQLSPPHRIKLKFPIKIKKRTKMKKLNLRPNMMPSLNSNKNNNKHHNKRFKFKKLSRKSSSKKVLLNKTKRKNKKRKIREKDLKKKSLKRLEVKILKWLRMLKNKKKAREKKRKKQ